MLKNFFAENAAEQKKIYDKLFQQSKAFFQNLNSLSYPKNFGLREKKLVKLLGLLTNLCNLQRYKFTAAASYSFNTVYIGTEHGVTFYVRCLLLMLSKYCFHSFVRNKRFLKPAQIIST